MQDQEWEQELRLLICLWLLIELRLQRLDVGCVVFLRPGQIAVAIQAVGHGIDVHVSPCYGAGGVWLRHGLDGGDPVFRAQVDHADAFGGGSG